GLGHTVSGSDRSGIARAPEGVTVYAGHDARHQAGAALVVRSAAVPDDNREVAAARARGVPVLKYAEALGRLTARRRTVAIAGTHGKTTTTALVAHLLEAAGADPGWIVGGRPLDRPPGRWGRGPLVVEACEYDRSFLNLAPEIAAVLSVAPDHLDCFGDAGGVRAAYLAFAGRLPAGAPLVLGGDVPADLPWPAGVRPLAARRLVRLLDVTEDRHGFAGTVEAAG